MATAVFVTGASGYIGQHVAIAFRNAGYRVYGLVRSQEKGEALIRNEVIPVVGDLQKPETWEWVIEKATYVIDTVPGYLSQEPWKGNRTLLEALAKSSEATGIRKTFIQTSGTLRYPDSKQVQDENTPIPPSDHPIFQAGREFEKLVLSHPVVRGIVIRPCAVYGGAAGTGNNLLRLFVKAKQEKIVLNNGLKDQRLNWVHVTDLADAYVRAAKRSHIVAGEDFNIVSESSPTYEEALRAAVAVAGFKGTVEYTDVVGPDLIEQMARKTVRLTYNKARDLLGWTPQHIGPLEELEIYYNACKESI